MSGCRLVKEELRVWPVKKSIPRVKGASRFMAVAMSCPSCRDTSGLARYWLVGSKNGSVMRKAQGIARRYWPP